MRVTVPHTSYDLTDMPRIAIFDDYQNVALELADWSTVLERANVIRGFDGRAAAARAHVSAAGQRDRDTAHRICLT